MNLDLVVPGVPNHYELEGDVLATSWRDWLRNSKQEFVSNDSRLGRRSEVAGKPNSGVEAEPKLVDHPVPLVVNVPEMYRMVSSKLIPI